MTAETNFFHQDDLRREWDKRYTSNKGSEQLRDVMMEEYMKKKRMIKQQRNDREELEEFEKNYIEVEEFESSKGRYALLLVVLGLVVHPLDGPLDHRPAGRVGFAAVLGEIVPVQGQGVNGTPAPVLAPSADIPALPADVGAMTNAEKDALIATLANYRDAQNALWNSLSLAREPTAKAQASLNARTAQDRIDRLNQ